MTVEIEHVPERTETVTEIVGEPEDDDEVLGHVEEPGRDYYKVRREITVTEEKYIVHTADGVGKESRTYYIEQGEGGDWYVAKRRQTPNRGHGKVAKCGTLDLAQERPDLSTQAVRDALHEQCDIGIVN